MDVPFMTTTVQDLEFDRTPWKVPLNAWIGRLVVSEVKWAKGVLVRRHHFVSKFASRDTLIVALNMGRGC